MRNRTSLFPLFASLLLVALTLVAPAPGRATSFVMVSDEDLADQASLIVSGRVWAVGAPMRGSLPATDYAVEVERRLKGESEASIVVRVPGGRTADGRLFQVAGAPALAAGERVLLFLVPRADGSYAPLHLMLGAFHEVMVDGASYAWRDLREATELARSEKSAEDGAGEPARAFDAFADWLADRTAGGRAPADYQLPESPALKSSALAALDGTAKYTLNRLSDGAAVRWFTFDRGGKVNWMVHEAGQPGMGQAESVACFQTALAAWNAAANDVPGSNIRLAYTGTNRDTSGLRRTSGGQTVLFNDPNADIPGTFQCGQGGVAAIAGVWAEAGSTSFRGASYHSLVESHIVVNDGTDCLTTGNPRVMEEILAHELGHSLGFGHSTDKEALMYPTAHNDGRGARLEADDLTAVSNVYGDGSYVPPPAPAPSPSVALPGAPGGLKAANVQRGGLVLQWQAGKGGSATEFHVERKVGKSFVEIGIFAGSAQSATLTGLPAGQVVLRVRAKNDAGYSPYSKSVAARLPR